MFESCSGESSSRTPSPSASEVEDDESHPIEGVVPNPAALEPIEKHYGAKFSSKDERVLRHNYDISDSVSLHFKDPVLSTFSHGEVCLYERMFLAGLRLPFLAIAWELLCYLQVAPSQSCQTVGDTSLLLIFFFQKCLMVS